jgi:hypothetical protein
MRAHILAGLLAAATGLLSAHAQAALTPTIEFEEGPLASVPVTGGSISGGGLTATGAPLIGGSTQSILQFGGNVTMGAFDPLQISVTEFNLTSLNGLSSFVSAISGSLPATSSVSWSAYVDPTNTPFGTTDLIASNSFANPGSLISPGFTNSVPDGGDVNTPFSLTELLTVTAPLGEVVSFNSSITATADPVNEPGALGLLGVGLVGLGLVTSRRRPARPAAA